MQLPDASSPKNRGPLILILVVIACVWAVNVLTPDGGFSALEQQALKDQRSQSNGANQKKILDDEVGVAEANMQEPTSKPRRFSMPMLPKLAMNKNKAKAKEQTTDRDAALKDGSVSEAIRSKSPDSSRRPTSSMGSGYDKLVEDRIAAKLGFSQVLYGWPESAEVLSGAIGKSKRPLGSYRMNGRNLDWNWYDLAGNKTLLQIKKNLDGFAKVVPSSQPGVQAAITAYAEALQRFSESAEAGDLPFKEAAWALEELDLYVTISLIQSQADKALLLSWAKVDLTPLVGSGFTMEKKAGLLAKYSPTVELVSVDLYRSGDPKGELDLKSPVFVKLGARILGDGVKGVVLLQGGKQIKKFAVSPKRGENYIEAEGFPARFSTITISDASGRTYSHNFNFGKLNHSFGWQRSSVRNMYVLRSVQNQILARSSNTF